MDESRSTFYKILKKGTHLSTKSGSYKLKCKISKSIMQTK